MKHYETLGVMLDMSRNAVMSVEALKKYFVYLHKMGYNCVMLYTEDTYEVEGALSAIAEIDGRAVSEEIVKDIFSKFCVGK